VSTAATYRRRRCIAALTLVLAMSVPAAALARSGGGAELPPARPGAVSASAPRKAPTDLTTSTEPATDPGRLSLYRSRIDWRPSVAVGETNNGHLVRGVQLPPQGRNFFTWDSVKLTKPNRGWRRWGTAYLLRIVLRVARQYRAAHPRAPRLTIGDIARPHGGSFGAEFGGIGHASHQNGLDIDIYYPRNDRRELPPVRVSQIDMRLSQDLVTRFVRAGAEYVFVGPSTTLHGPPNIVQTLVNHDNHLHVRVYNPLR
jgi:hypothetical protein